jgi:hypothetical protein
MPSSAPYCPSSSQWGTKFHIHTEQLILIFRSGEIKNSEIKCNTHSENLICYFMINKIRDSSVGIALGYLVDDRDSRVRFRAGAGNFSLHHRVQTGSGAHPASYPMGTWGSFLGGKATGAWSWPLTPSSSDVKECVELYLHSPYTPSWRGAQLKHRDNFTFTFISWLISFELFV